LSLGRIQEDLKLFQNKPREL